MKKPETMTQSAWLLRWCEEPEGTPDLNMALALADAYGGGSDDAVGFGDERDGMALAMGTLAAEVRKLLDAAFELAVENKRLREGE